MLCGKVGSFKEGVAVWLRLLLVSSRPSLLGFKFRGSCLRRRTGFTMAELISFVVPTQSDKVLLVWDLNAGPPAESLSVRGRAKGRRGGREGGGRRREPALREGRREPAGHP